MSGGPILITGATGFVGQHLLMRLVTSGRRVVALHHRPLAPEVRARFGSTIEWWEADIVSTDFHSLLQGISTVFHLAAKVTNSEASADIAEMDRINVLGSERLAEASKCAGVSRFIFISSVAACEYGAGAGKKIDERTGYAHSSYGKSKLRAESALLRMSDETFGVTVLRPSALFGEDHLGSMYELVKVIQLGHFVIIGSGKNHTNFYYIDDFIDLMVAIEYDKRTIGEVFIASDEPCTVEVLVAAINTALGSRKNVRNVPKWFGYLLAWCCDAASALTGRTFPLSIRRVRAMTRDVIYSNDKIRSALSLKASRGLQEGLRNSIEWYRRAGLL